MLFLMFLLFTSSHVRRSTLATMFWFCSDAQDNNETDYFALRGPRLLIAWPYLDEAYCHLFGSKP